MTVGELKTLLAEIPEDTIVSVEKETTYHDIKTGKIMAESIKGYTPFLQISEFIGDNNEITTAINFCPDTLKPLVWEN